MDSKNLEFYLKVAGVPYSARQRILKEKRLAEEAQLKEDFAGDISDHMAGNVDPTAGSLGGIAKPLKGTDQEEPSTFKSPFKKGQIVKFKGMKYRVQVPDAQANFVGVAPLDGGKVSLVRSDRLELVEAVDDYEDQGMERVPGRVGRQMPKDESGRSPEINALLDAVAKAMAFVGYTASVEDIKEELEEAFHAVAGMPTWQWQKGNLQQQGVDIGEAHEIRRGANIDDKNEQPESDDLTKSGADAIKKHDSQEPDDLADVHELEPNEMDSEDFMDMTVPAKVKTSLQEKIDELRKQADLVGTRDAELADFYTRSADFFEGLLQRLKTGDKNEIKMAVIEAHRVVSVMRHLLPDEVWDYFTRGGRTRTIADYFREVKKSD